MRSRRQSPLSTGTLRETVNECCTTAILLCLILGGAHLYHRSQWDRPAIEVIDAAVEGDLDALARAAGRCRSLEASDDGGRTPLTAAARAGQTGAVEFLLSRGVRVDAGDDQVGTPLVHAALARRAEVVDLLIRRGANVHAASSGGGPDLLTAAVLGGDERCVRLVLAGGSERNAPRRRPCNPYSYLDDNQVPILRLLLRAGIDPKLRNADGSSPIQVLADRGADECVRMLVEAGVPAPKPHER